MKNVNQNSAKRTISLRPLMIGAASLIFCLSAFKAFAQAAPVADSIVITWNGGKAPNDKVTFSPGKTAGTYTVAFPEGEPASFNDLTGNATGVRTVNQKAIKKNGLYLLRYLNDLTITLQHNGKYKGNDFEVVQYRPNRKDGTTPSQDIAFCFVDKLADCRRDAKVAPAGLYVYANVQLVSFRQDPVKNEGTFNFAKQNNMKALFGNMIANPFGENSPGVLTLTVTLPKGFDLNKLKKDAEAAVTGGDATIPPATKDSSSDMKLTPTSESGLQNILVGSAVPLAAAVTAGVEGVPGVPVVFTVVLGDASFSGGELALDGKQSTVMTDENGNATVNFVAGQPGLSIIQITSQGQTEKVAVSATNIAPSTW